ncbi:MAG: OmpA family protein [Myxococcota bacterium]|jgi:chemotaxis protein MotB|nr:OmpA family protein [Myxococcota bacterium]
MRNEPFDRSRADESGPGKQKNWLSRLVMTTVLLLSATGGLGYYAWNLRTEHADSTTRAAECTEQLTSLNGKAATMAQQLQQCNALSTTQDSEKKAQAENLAAMSENLDATKAELTELRKQRAETAKRLEAFRGLTEKFRKMIDSGKLDVVVRDGRMMVKMPAAVLFASGSADLSRDGELALMEVAVVLRQLPDRRFMVIGHTDNLPLENAANKEKYATNWELSTARAVNVTKFLVEARLDPRNLIAAGHAEFDPASNNNSNDGRQANRRIEIVLMPNLEELPPMPTE